MPLKDSALYGAYRRFVSNIHLKIPTGMAGLARKSGPNERKSEKSLGTGWKLIDSWMVLLLFPMDAAFGRETDLDLSMTPKVILGISAFSAYNN